jgi:hypothetical protein
MTAASRDRTPVAFATDEAEVRTAEIGGGYTVAWISFAKGTDMTPAFKGLPGDLCPCPHWGCVTKGTVRMHLADGHEDYTAGEAFYWAPGHAPEALEDCEFIDFSPTEEFEKVVAHLAEATAAAGKE